MNGSGACLVCAELADHLEVEWRPGEGGPGRKYFALTRTGREHARHQAAAAEWAAFTTRVLPALTVLMLLFSWALSRAT